MKVSSFWFKGERDDRQKEAVSADLLSARAAFARLRVLLEEEMAAITRGVRSQDNYKTIPNWDRWVADQFGYLRALDKLIERIPNYDES